MDAPGTGTAAKDQPRQNGAIANAADWGSPNPLSAPEPEAAGLRGRELEFRRRWRLRFTIAAIVITLIAAALILPPLISIGRYKHQITSLMTRSLGRPVRLSSVGLRLLPMPGFVLHDLSVSEDPRYGAEPVISAGSVIARVNLFALWRGRLEISRISVDEASLNLVHTADGRWNIDSLMLGAQPTLTGGAQPGQPPARSHTHFPYLEATNSRVNLKYGDEKKPYALTAADLSLWQDSPGLWRFRLKGQPARTDIPMSSADAGELQAEGSLHRAATLRDMPLSLQVEWREAQLGQLSRLLLGSDSGWRGDVTADIEVHGTAENAQTRARLRVAGIRREEFTPKTDLNFEANCTLRYQHSLHAVHDLACDTDSGGGQIHLRADLPGAAGPPHGTLEVHDVPLQGGLDLLRSIRNGFAPGVSLSGKVNGNLTYTASEPPSPQQASPRGRQARSALQAKTSPNPKLSALRGELVVEGARLESDALKTPLILPRMAWTPVSPEPAVSGKSQAGKNGATMPEPPELALSTRFIVPTGNGRTTASQPATQPPAPSPAASNASPDTPRAQAPASKTAPAPAAPIADAEVPARAEAQALTVQMTLAREGYEAQIEGTGNIARLRELAYALGTPRLQAIDVLNGSVDQVSLHAAGPWLPSTDIGVEISASSPPSQDSNEELLPHSAPAVHEKGAASAKVSSASGPTSAPIPNKDTLGGTILLRRASWSPAYLVSPVTLNQAALNLSLVNLTFTSGFTFGGAKEPAQKPEPQNPGAKNPEASKTDAQAAAATPAAGAPAPASSSPASSSIVRGSVTINSSIACAAAECQPHVQLHFAALNAADLQSALLNAPRPKGFFAPFIDSIRSSQPSTLPDFDAEIDVTSFTVGPLTFPFTAKLHPRRGDFLIDSWTASLFGGSAQGTGQVTLADGKPAYSLDGSFNQANGSSLAAFAGVHATGGTVSGTGQVQLSGLTAKDLAASAKGQIHFDWHSGSIQVPGQIPGQPSVSRFDDWSGAATLSGGKAELGENSLVHGRQTVTLSGSMPFGEPPKLAIAPAVTKPEPKLPSPVQ